MAKDRFKTWRSDYGLSSGAWVKVKDTETGNEVENWGKDEETAEKNAWDALKEKQGPPPSQ